MSEPQIVAVGGARRRRGRPASTAATRKERRTFYLPTTYLDRIDRLALKHGVSSNEALRRVVELALRTPPAEFPDSKK